MSLCIDGTFWDECYAIVRHKNSMYTAWNVLRISVYVYVLVIMLACVFENK